MVEGPEVAADWVQVGPGAVLVVAAVAAGVELVAALTLVVTL